MEDLRPAFQRDPKSLFTVVTRGDLCLFSHEAVFDVWLAYRGFVPDVIGSKPFRSNIGAVFILTLAIFAEFIATTVSYTLNDELERVGGHRQKNISQK